jgi:hypothetical protein
LISSQSGDEINKKVGWRTVAGMLDMAQSLQLINDGFDDAAFGKEESL